MTGIHFNKEVTEKPVYRELHSMCLPASLPHMSVSVFEIN
jgi:hypothetical protein